MKIEELIDEAIEQAGLLMGLCQQIQNSGEVDDFDFSLYTANADDLRNALATFKEENFEKDDH